MRKVVSVLLAVSLAAAYSGVGARAQGSPHIRADLDSDTVALLGYPPGTLITVSIDGASWEVTAPPGGELPRLDRWQHGRDLVPGMTVTAAAGGFATRELVLADLGVDVVNPETDSVVVRSPGITPPAVTVWDPAGQAPPAVTATFDIASQRWVASFAPFDVGYGAWGTAVVPDGDGDETADARSTPYVDMERPGHRNWEAVDANDFSPDTTLCMQVYSSPKAIGKEQPPCTDIVTDAAGRARHDIWDQDHVPLGAAVVVTQSPPEVGPAAALSKTVEVADVEITLVNPTLDRVTGTVVAGTAPNAVADVVVGVGGWNGWSTITLPGVAGAWTADFAALDPPFDVRGDAWGSARIVDAEGDASAFGRNAPRISASPLGGPWGGPSSIQAEDFPAQAELAVDVFEDDTAAATRFHGAITTWDSGEGGLGLPLVLLPGNLVRVEDPALGVTKELTVADFGIAFVDVETDVVDGTAPVGGDWGDVELYLPDGFTTGAVNLPRTATWSVDLSPYGDVGEYFGTDAAVRDADNDQLTAWRNAPSLEVRVSDGGRLEREAAPLAVAAFRSSVPVTFEVFADEAAAAAGTPLLAATRSTNASGDAHVAREALAAGLVPGNVVRATGGGLTMARTVTGFSWGLDTAAPAEIEADGSPRYTPYGIAPAGSFVDMFAGEGDGGGQVCGDCLAAPGVIEDPEGSGIWRFAPPPDGFAVGRHTGFGVVVAGTLGGKPPFTVNANPAANTVEVRGALPGEPVRVDIAASGGAPVLYSASTTAGALGSFTIGSGDHATDIATDQVVTVTGLQTGWVQRLLVDPFTFTVLDPAADLLAGTAPAGKEVLVQVESGPTAEGFLVSADAGGNWSLDLTGRLDLLDGSVGVAALRPAQFVDNTVVLRGPVSAEIAVPAAEPTTVTTDAAGDGATPGEPVETTVVVPPGATGTVSIVEEEVLPYLPEEYAPIQEEVVVEAPTTSPDDPLTLEFQIDGSQLGGRPVDDVAVFKDGSIVGDCTSTTGAIAPDPCVSAATTTGAGDGAITVLTSDASRWSFAFPHLLATPVLAPDPVRLGQASTLTAAVQPGVTGGEFFVGADPGVGNGAPMALAGGVLIATVNGDGGLPAGVHRVGVRGLAGAVWTPTAEAHLVVYDPAGATAAGSGSIVPGGPTSDVHPADRMPGLDGTTAAQFAFDVRYPKRATVPSGSLTFAYGTGFSLASTGMAWLAVTGTSATFQGTAAVNGVAGHTFRVSVVDGSDRFELRVWAPGRDPDRTLPDHQASGDLTRGRVRLR